MNFTKRTNSTRLHYIYTPALGRPSAKISDSDPSIVIVTCQNMNLRDSINEVLQKASITDFNFVRLTKWEGVLDQMAERFLKNGSRGLGSIWLWESFKEPVTVAQPTDPLGYLNEQLDQRIYYWFLASEENGKYWVAEATGKAIIRVIEDMYGFEYYVANQEMEWIFCENHHSAFVHHTHTHSTECASELKSADVDPARVNRYQ